MPTHQERRPHGRTVPIGGGVRAFVPAPLPPPIAWDEEIARWLAFASEAVGSIRTERWRLPNPELIFAPFVRREAMLSSRIEGTRTTLDELLAPGFRPRSGAEASDLREVRNYVTALEYGLKRLDTLPLSLRLIREIHARLMDGVRGNTPQPGEFRRTQNWIGSAGGSVAEATYVPPPPNELGSCLGDLERFLHDQSLPPLAHAALAHVQFEAIHPFLDGNGRVGRMLITLLLKHRNALGSPLLYLSAHFEEDRDEYYARLRAVTEQGAWEEWLVYFLRGVWLQAQDVLARVERVEQLLADWRDRLTGLASAPARSVLDLFVENPFWTIGAIAERLDVAYTTAARAVERLCQAGIVSLTGTATRNRVYCARAMLDLLNEPAATSYKSGPAPD